MADGFPHPTRPIDPTEDRINFFFDRIIICINARRKLLLATAEEIRNAKILILKRRVDGSRQLEATKEEIERNLMENNLRETQEILLREVERKLEEVRTPVLETRVAFRGECRQVEQLIAALGEIREERVPAVPRYEAMRPIVAAGKRGKAPGELWYPKGVAIDSNTNNIYVAEGDTSSDYPRISIFSEGGDILDNYTHEHMISPHGIAIHRDSLYVTDVSVHAVLLFRIKSDIRFVTKVGTRGDGNVEFNNPFSLAVSAEGDVYIADCNNNRIQILDSCLRYLKILTEQPIRAPRDIKLTADSVYVLCGDSPCILVFSYTGDMLRYLVTRGDQLQVKDARHFCLDAQESIIISDRGASKIKVFSKEGTLIRTVGGRREGVGMFDFLQGITLTSEMDLIFVSCCDNKCLHIFSFL